MKRWRYSGGNITAYSETIVLKAWDEDEIVKRLRTAISKEWNALITAHVPPSHQEVYRKGMSIQPDGGEIVMRLQGFDAVKADVGWAPAQEPGGSLKDGLRTYDGSEKDMRPSVLGGAKQKIIRFDLAKSAQQVGDDYKKALTTVMMAGGISKAHVKNETDYYRMALLRLKPPPGDTNAKGHDRVGGVLADVYVDSKGMKFKYVMPKMLEKHRSSVHARITRTVKADGKRGWLYSIFRTMTSDRDDRWHTAGTPPSNVLDRLEKRLPAIVKVAMGGG
jgi:hypothetical protein